MNNPILIPTPVRYRKRRGRSRRKPRLPGLPLELVAASYVTATSVQIEFDRAINVSGMNPAYVIVFDGPNSIEYTGTGTPTLVNPTTVSVGLAVVGPTGGGQVLLTVYTDSGIVAVDDGGTFPGIAAQTLPYP